jgi:hypothetical protein
VSHVNKVYKQARAAHALEQMQADLERQQLGHDTHNNERQYPSQPDDTNSSGESMEKEANMENMDNSSRDNFVMPESHTQKQQIHNKKYLHKFDQ